MKTNLDCIPCFFRQALEGARFARANASRQKQVIDAFAKEIPRIPLDSSPPEIARIVYGFVKKINRDEDPYKNIKSESNRIALRLYDKLKTKVKRSGNGLKTAVELAIAGNVIDFGAKNNLDIHEELERITRGNPRSRRAVRSKVRSRNESLFHFAEFKHALKKAKRILYLADNAGELVLDRILIEEILGIYPGKDITLSVKEKPAINDALAGDARECGIDRIVRVVSNGSDAPGTVLGLCSKEFRRLFGKSDMIISKGQGNFESLSETKKPVFFLFKVKCQVVAKHTGLAMGESVLYHLPSFTRFNRYSN